MTKTVCLIAGEKSGDLIGSKIMDKIKSNHSDVNFVGIGGELMQSSGLNSVFPMNELSVMGIGEVIPKLANILKRIKETANFIIENKPDMVITIDSPDFNFRVMKLVKKYDKNSEIKKVHFIAPSVWAYRKSRAKKISKIYDLLFCILPFELSYFEKYGLRSVFVGHPMFSNDKDDKEVNNTYNFNSNIISITLGSRVSEVKRHLPIIKKVIEKIKDKEFYILATENTKDYILKNINNQNVKIVSELEEKNKIIKLSKLVIAKSGTNNLEIASLGVPMIVYYKFGFITNIVAESIRKKADRSFANLINIINNEEIIPEILLFDCNAKNVLNKVNYMFNNKDICEKQIKKNIETVKILGFNNSIKPIDTIYSELNRILYEN